MSEFENLGYSFIESPLDTKIIKVVGVGGGGSNAVNYMYDHGNIKDVDYMVCNTDKQALNRSKVPSKVLLGRNATEGLGAGGDPTMGQTSAREVEESIRENLSNGTKMVFITVGMGGGTGTGAGPVVAEIARSLDILTVGIVTMPFLFEGPEKQFLALKGIEDMAKYCDTMLVVMNEKIFQLYPDLNMNEAFKQVDSVLLMAAKSIAEIITVEQNQNMDFKDVERALKGSGSAVMGTSITSGENRATESVEEALSSPLLYKMDIQGAKSILVSMVHGSGGVKVTETQKITDLIRAKTGSKPLVKLGFALDETIPPDEMRLTIVATGFANNLSKLAEMLDVDISEMEEELLEEEIYEEEVIETPVYIAPEPVFEAPEPAYVAPRVEPVAQPTSNRGFIPNVAAKAQEAGYVPQPEPRYERNTFDSAAQVTVVGINNQIEIDGKGQLESNKDGIVNYPDQDRELLSAEARKEVIRRKAAESQKANGHNAARYDSPPVQRRSSGFEPSRVNPADSGSVSFNDKNEVVRENRRFRDSVD